MSDAAPSAIEITIDGKTHVIDADELDLDHGVDLSTIPDDFSRRVETTVDNLLTPFPPTPDEEPDHEDDEDDDGDSTPTFIGSTSTDSELELVARISTAHRVLAERRYEEAQAECARNPDSDIAQALLADAQVVLVTAKAEAADDLTRWLNRTAARTQRERFAKVIESRRHELRMTREQLASRCQLSASTIKNLETSSDPDRIWNAKTRAAIEEAFQWAAGSFDAVLDGGDPSPLPPPDPSTPAPVPSTPDPRMVEIRAAVGVALSIEPQVYERIERLAIFEDRNVNDILEQALDLYWRIKGPRPKEGKHD